MPVSECLAADRQPFSKFEYEIFNFRKMSSLKKRVTTYLRQLSFHNESCFKDDEHLDLKSFVVQTLKRFVYKDRRPPPPPSKKVKFLKKFASFTVMAVPVRSSFRKGINFKIIIDFLSSADLT